MPVLSEKFGMAIFGHSEFIPVFLGKIVRKIQNGHFWFGKIVINGCSEYFSDNFSVHVTLLECNGLESNEIYTFLDFYSEI